MFNADYPIGAIDFLLNENCILKAYYPLIPYKAIVLEGLKALGCARKSDALRCSDEELLQAGLPEGLLEMFRRFLRMYDSKPQKMREIAAVSETPEEEQAFGELYALPGLKSTRARLYMRSGFSTLEEIAAASPEGLIAACRHTIEEECLDLKAPLLKEARTHVAVARAFAERTEGEKR